MCKRAFVSTRSQPMPWSSPSFERVACPAIATIVTQCAAIVGSETSMALYSSSTHWPICVQAPFLLTSPSSPHNNMEHLPSDFWTDDPANDSAEDYESVSFVCEDTFCTGSFSPLWYCGKCSCTYCGYGHLDLSRFSRFRRKWTDTLQARAGIVKYPTDPVKKEKTVYRTNR